MIPKSPKLWHLLPSLLENKPLSLCYKFFALGHMSAAPAASHPRFISPLRQAKMAAAAKSSSELPPDMTSSSSASSTQTAAQREKDKYLNVSDDESEQVTKVKTKHIHRTKDTSDDSSSSSSASAASSSSVPPSLFDDPVARVKAVQRGTWVRLLVLIFSLAVLFYSYHPTAYYRTQLYFGQCVDIPGRNGLTHRICPPQSIPHPLM